MSSGLLTRHSTSGSPAGQNGSPHFVFPIQAAVIASCLLLLVILVRLPRAIARFWSTSEWTSGHILQYTPSFARVGSQATTYTNTGSKQSPPHVSSSIIPGGRLVDFLRRQHAGLSLTVGQVLLLAAWLGLMTFPAIFRSAGPFKDKMRYGWIAIVQMPFVYAFGAKNSIPAMLISAGYEKLNFFHRFIGRLIVLAANIHAFYFFFKWCYENTFREKMAEKDMSLGLVALVCMDVLFFLSTAWWRKHYYRVFITSHILSAIIIIPALMYHHPLLVPWVALCLGFSLFDRLMRLVKSRITTVNLRPLPQLGMTQIECPNISSGWRAGQHVRIRVLSSGMGLLGWTEEHPFTVASRADGNGLVLLCKKAGSWTNNLYGIASQGGSLETGIGANARVVVEGPYGGPGHIMFASFSAALLIVGGSGIAYALGVIEELIAKDAAGASQIQAINLVWVVPDGASVTPLLRQLGSIIERCPVPVSIFVHATRASKEPVTVEESFPKRMHMSYGRPDLVSAMETTITTAIKPFSIGSRECGIVPSGMFVGVCGPTGLSECTAQAISRLDDGLREQIGGVELHREVFGL